MKKILIGFTLMTAAWSSEKISFTYVSMGVTGSVLFLGEVVGADPFIGRRQFFTPHHVLDVGVGLWASKDHDDPFIPTRLYYGQGSYIYYPFDSQGPYVGAGITVGTTDRRYGGLGWVNLPITLGYHYRSKNNLSSFLQCQVSPIMTPALGMATLSYGFGF